MNQTTLRTHAHFCHFFLFVLLSCSLFSRRWTVHGFMEVAQMKLQKESNAQLRNLLKTYRYGKSKPHHCLNMVATPPVPLNEEDPETALEAEKIMKQLEARASNIGNEETIQAEQKYMPSTSTSDPIVDALKNICKVQEVTGFELLDSRWNGNEGFCYDTSEGKFFVKLNRVEDPSVFMSEAVGLSALAKTETVKVPKPLHIGVLPKVSDIGPGTFMIIEWMELVPFGAMRSDNQKLLGKQLAQMHLSRVHDDVHKGRFGFPVSNFLALTPLDNTWCDSWPRFFRNRLASQVNAFYKDKVYGRRALGPEHFALKEKYRKIINEVIPKVFEGIEITPSLVHGDLWIGNSGATDEGPCIFDPACFFGHSEFELSIMEMFGGFSEAFWESYHSIIPKQEGYSSRSALYQLYHYSNQLNLFGDPGVLKKCNELCDEILKFEEA